VIVIPAPVPTPQAKVFLSPDGSRKVLVSGTENWAYLYDRSFNPAFQPKFLGRDVESVQFETDPAGRLTGIVIILEDGAYNLFDRDGNPESQIVYSPDRTRKLEISGEDRDAYLYDTAQQAAFAPVFLGSFVTSVQFQRDAQGQFVAVTLAEDGSVNIFDRFGSLLETRSTHVTTSNGEEGEVSISSVGAGLTESASFGTLTTGAIVW